MEEQDMDKDDKVGDPNGPSTGGSARGTPQYGPTAAGMVSPLRAGGDTLKKMAAGIGKQGVAAMLRGQDPEQWPLRDRIRARQQEYAQQGHAALTTAKQLDELLSQVTPVIEELGRALHIIEQLRKHGIWTA